MSTAPADVRVAIIGAGFGARVVAPSFDGADGCSVVDVASARDDDAIRALCTRADVDLVSVHSPPFLHERHVGYALDAGKSVLCDKPFGRNADEAARMLDAAEQAGALHLLNFEFRCQPARERLRDVMTSGELGDIEHVTWLAYSAGSRVPLRRYGWLFNRELGGGWIGAWGSHIIDALRWMAGEIEHAVAWSSTKIRERPDADGQLHTCDAEDSFVAALRLANGVTVGIDTTFVAPVGLPSRVVVVGSKGTAELAGETRLIVRTAEGSREEPIDASGASDPHIEPMRRWATVVGNAVRAGTAPPTAPTFHDGLACARVMDMMRTPGPF